MKTDLSVPTPSFQTTLRWWDWPAALMLLAGLFFSGARLAATHWVSNLSLVQPLILLGAVLGLALGQSRFSPRTNAALGMAYGLCILPWQWAHTLITHTPWADRMLSLGSRAWFSLQSLVTQQPVDDPLLFLILVSTLFWALAIHAGYSLTRHGNPWMSIIPAGIAILIFHIFDPFFPSRSWLVAGYIFFSLLLINRLILTRRQRTWRKKRIHMPPFLGFDLTRNAAVAAAILITIAWNAPKLATSFTSGERGWQALSSPLEHFQQNFENAFAALRSSVGVVQDYYGDQLPLGRGNLLNDSPVLLVKAPQRPNSGVRYYWRARVFDTFDQGTWTNTLDQTQRFFDPQVDELSPPSEQGRWETVVTITPQQRLSTLYAPSQPVWFSHPAKGWFASNPDGSLELGLLQAVPLLRPGDTYQVRSSLTSATQSQLRQSGNEYPAWISARYLQLPESITPRTIALAAQITAGLENPFDKVQAITQYLRNHLTYQDTVPEAPADQDVIDWILFDHQQGFCNYYATAEIMMLRSLGIPARIAVGYAQGDRQTGNSYLVRQRDAHAWPEVYFVGIGWVEFEPTVSQRPIDRPLGEPLPEQSTLANNNATPATPKNNNLSDRQDRLPEDQPLPDGGQVPQTFWQHWRIFLWAAIGLLILILGVYWGLKRSPQRTTLPQFLIFHLERAGFSTPTRLKKWAHHTQLSRLERAYQQINRSLRWLGGQPPISATPAMRAEQLTQILPQAEEEITRLLAVYQNAMYSPHSSSDTAAFLAARAIQRKTWATLFQQFLVRFQEPAK